MRQSIHISKDKNLLDYSVISQFLKGSYWAKNRTNDQIRKSISNSICYGMYSENEQIGFARVITDYSTFGYIGDVFILESSRGRGYGTELMNAILLDEEFKDLSKWYLITKDAQKLYQNLGFSEYNSSDKMVMIKKLN